MDGDFSIIFSIKPFRICTPAPPETRGPHVASSESPLGWWEVQREWLESQRGSSNFPSTSFHDETSTVNRPDAERLLQETEAALMEIMAAVPGGWQRVWRAVLNSR